MKPKNYAAALTLFFLPAISVELLTGDTPLATYLNPITFVVLNLTYGATLLLIRETVVRWRKGFASVLVLAAGYGMVNEAIDTKGFFAPHFYAVVGSGLEGFGRHIGINIPWALNISIFHAIFSILVPLTIVSAIFRDAGPWIGNKLHAAILVAVVACSVFSYKVFALPPDYYRYSEGAGPILLILVLIATLIFLAWRLPTPHPHRWHLRLNAVTLFALGCFFTIAFVNSPSRVQAATGSPGAYVAFVLIVFVALPVWLIFKLPQPTAYGKIAFVTGLLMPIMIAGLHAGIGGRVATGFTLTLIAAAFWRNRGQALPASPIHLTK
jgi:hypothetical protein